MNANITTKVELWISSRLQCYRKSSLHTIIAMTVSLHKPVLSHPWHSQPIREVRMTYLSKLAWTISARNLLSSQHWVIRPRASPAAQRSSGLVLARTSCKDKMAMGKTTRGTTSRSSANSRYHDEGKSCIPNFNRAEGLLWFGTGLHVG